MPAHLVPHGLPASRSTRRIGAVIMWLAAFLGLASIARAQGPDLEPAVKMSRSGICHERGTVHYQQTIYFQPFDSLEACLASGGRRMGGEPSVRAPAYDYRATHPPRSSWPYALIATAAVLVVGFLLRHRWQVRRTYREFEDRSKRRWEGHKLEPKRRNK